MLTAQIIETAVSAALAEDAPQGDITSETLIPADAIATAILNSRETGVFSGADVIVAAFKLTDASVQIEMKIKDGEQFAAGQTLAVITGNARAILTAERVALNFSQRMCGIATQTARYVAAVKGTGARILDTRKTTPLLRAFEKYAVTCGGGYNHRFSLSDMVMAKDNHLAVLTRGGLNLTNELARVREQLPENIKLEVEVDRLDQIEPVLAAKPDIIMLDNFSLDELRAGVAQIAKRATVEASGGVNLSTVRAIAETGVDVISVGALTHHIAALDLGLDIEIH